MTEEQYNEDQWINYLAGESAPPQEQGTADSPGLSELEKAWHLSGTAYVYRKTDTEQAWDHLNRQMEENKPPVIRRRLSYLRYAAAVTILALLGTVTFILVRNPAKDNNQMTAAVIRWKTVQTKKNPASVTTLQLPDGSTVRLNAGTTLRYAEPFSNPDRKIMLSGEAYFDVVHDPAHPFVVETANARIEDLGTSFNISAYPDRAQVVVNVTSGSVKLSDNLLHQTTVLQAGSHGKLLAREGKIETSGELSPNYLSWVTRQLTFRHTPLSEVFDELENIYHIPIEMADPGIGGISYTANFDHFEIDDILNIIARTHHLVVTKQQEKFIFSAR